MNASEKFFRRLDKMKNSLKNPGLKDTVGPVADAFHEAMGKVPEELPRGIYMRFLDAFNRKGGPEESFLDAAYSLGPYIDIFWMDYDAGAAPLAEEDWNFLRDEVSASACELDMDIVTYVMRLVMDYGKL